MKIVFMGTPDFASPCLERLIKLKYDVAAVFTQPDKPSGRGYKLMPPAVKVTALEYGLTVHQPDTLKSGEAETLLKELEPDLIVVVAYGKLLPKNILDIPKLGCINIHGSLLPKYRGAAPIQYAVLNGDKITGVTSMYMDVGLDTGDIILKYETEIGKNETSGELFDRLSLLGADCLEETVKLIENGTAPRIKQDDLLATYTKQLDRSLSEIDFTKDTAEEIHNKIRGLSPWPCAVTYVNGLKLKLFSSIIAEEISSKEAGELLSEKKMIISCKTGAVELTSVQGEGSKRMSGEDFLRGKRLPIGTKFEIKG